MGALYVHCVRVFLMNEHDEWMAHVLDIVQKEQGIFLWFEYIEFPSIIKSIRMTDESNTLKDHVLTNILMQGILCSIFCQLI